MKMVSEMYNLFLAANIGRGPLLAVFETIVRARILERKLVSLYGEGKVKRTVHSDYGQEGGVATIVSLLDEKDMVLPHYRGYTLALGRGLDMKGIIGEMMVKKAGAVEGYGGIGNFTDIDHGMYPVSPVLGQGFSLAIGMALAARFRGDGSRVAVFFGDGTTTRGNFYSALNLAVLWSLPILFVCLNNKYSATTRFDSISSSSLAEKVRSFRMQYELLDGNDVVGIFRKAQAAVREVREKCRPVFIELDTYRMGGHSVDDKAGYMPSREKKQWMKRDPLDMLEKTMRYVGFLSRDEAEAFGRKCIREADAAAIESEESGSRSLEELEQGIYA